MRVLVCGGRTYTDRLAVFNSLDRLDKKTPVTCVIHGAARGADTLARDWARYRGIPDLPFPAEWKKYGKSAGAIRNEQMIREGTPDGVVAFPGSEGTADMKTRSRRHGLIVWEPIPK